jgi:VWFA-related protein
MTRSTCLLALTLGMGNLLVIRGADEPVVFRSDVSLVRVDAQVVDRDNRAITGLQQEDFVLREEGQPQPIRNFANESMPVDIVLLLDVSASMRPHVERIASAAHQALQVLGEGDRVAIMVFDRSSRVRLPFRSAFADVERGLESLLNQETFNGGTDITRGMLDAANYIAKEGRRDARHAIVILTDDQTERNRDEDGVSRALTRADTVLSALLAPDAMQGGYGGMGGGRRGGGTWPGSGGGGIGGPLGGIILGRRGPYGGRGGGPGGGPVMIGGHTHSAGTAEIARRSGGDSMSVDDASALETTLTRIRQRYALYFYLPQGVKPGQERAIEVDLADAARRRYSNAEVRYRRMYLAPGGPADSPSGGEPVVVTQAPSQPSSPSSDSGDDSRPRLRRRPSATGVPDGSRDGPLNPGSDSASDPSQPYAPSGGWRPAQPGDSAPAGGAPAARTATARPSTASASGSATDAAAPPVCGGWRRVDEPEQPPCLSDPQGTTKPQSTGGKQQSRRSRP